MKAGQAKTTIRFFTAVFVAVVCLFSLFLPFPKRATGEEYYECTWSDGSVSVETYDTAYLALTGISEAGVTLERGSLTGTIPSDALEIYNKLSANNLGDLLQATSSGVTRIDRAAIYRTFGDTVWYDNGYYVYNGERVEEVKTAQCDRLVYLNGNVLTSVLKATRAKELCISANAEVKPKVLGESAVKTLRAQAPYSASQNALYLNTAGGKRLLAALGSISVLAVDEDTAFADAGALLYCTQLTRLKLPFAGSARGGSAYRGEVAYLFSNGREYRVPPSLSYVEITGGKLISYAFYGCKNVKEINVCSLPAESVSPTAFAGLSALQTLHTKRTDVALTGEFASHAAPCGCTVYQRVG